MRPVGHYAGGFAVIFQSVPENRYFKDAIIHTRGVSVETRPLQDIMDIVTFHDNENSTAFSFNSSIGRAFSGIGRIASDFDLLLASNPKFLSGAIQDKREKCDHHRPKGDDVVMASVVPNISEKPEDRFMHGGAGIIAGIIFGACFLAYQYARGRL